ncbi:MAG: DUF1573 domain-containing protein [Aureliella sp.]
MRPIARCCAASTLAFATLCAPIAAQAQNWLREAIPSEQRTHDFGNVARAAKTEHRFEIKNPHNTEMHIRSVRASCGCTTPIIETKTIPPGGTGTILARFNTGTFKGHKSATLTVSIDRPFFTELQLRVKGYIRSDIVIAPGEANFGDVTLGEGKELDLNLEYAGRSDWKIQRVESPRDFVDVQFEEVSRGGGRVKYIIHAKVADGAPMGRIQDQLILHTNDRNITSVPLRLLANVQPMVQTSPSQLALELDSAESFTQRLVIKAPEAFKILDISSEIADIKFEASDASKSAHLLNITLTPKGNKRLPAEGVVLVKTDLREEPTELPLSFVGSAIAADSGSNITTPPRTLPVSK